MRVRLLLASLALVAACTPLAQEGQTFVRLHNSSPHQLQDVRVTFAGERVAYGDLAPGGTSGYRLAQGAYRYAALEARVGGEPFALRPIDFVGETPLGPGRFTYRLESMPDRNGIQIVAATRDE